MLIECTFGRKRPVLTCETSIDFKTLSHEDLHKLANMVCVEYLSALSDEIRRDVPKGRRKDTPHVYDVFLLDSSFYKQGGDLTICRPTSGGVLLMQDKDNNFLPVEEAPCGRRVASLSSAARILESLMSQPDVGSLMHHAMKRDMIADIGASTGAHLPPSVVDGLNTSQRAVVETVASNSFEFGFAAVMGPPGTGVRNELAV